MSASNTDFFVIYNRALSPMAETDDTRLSLRFTEDLVQFLENDGGHKGHYGDRDSKPGCNIFDELRRNIKETRKTFLVVTQGFMMNCWATYCAQSAFKTLLDTKKSDKLIPIGINISECEQVDALNITEWIHFSSDWHEKTSKKWNIIRQVLQYDGPLNKEPTYKEYIHVQEHGDNKLRSDKQILVVHPTSLQGGEFLKERYLMNLAKNFPADWKTLAINLELNDNTVTECERNNPGNVQQQAYVALNCWKCSHAGPEEKKVEFLLSVLLEMGKKMLAETIKADYKKHTQQAGSSPSLAAGGDVDEVDTGMFRRSNTGQADRGQQTRRGEDDHSTGNPLHTTNVTRELQTVTACIEAEPKADPDAAPISSNSVQLQQGPSMSLPPAPILKLPNLEVSNETNGSKPEIKMHQLTSNDSIDGKESSVSDVEQFTRGSADHDAMENLPVVNEHVVLSAAQNQLTERNVHDNVLYAQTGTIPHGEVSYHNKHSLSEDDDLTADVNGTYSRQSATDSSQSTTDSSKSTTDSNKSVTDSNKSATDSNKSATDSSKSATDSSTSATDSNKSATDYSQSAPDSNKSTTDSSKSTTDSNKSVTDSNKSAIDSNKSVTESRKSATDSNESTTDSSKSVTDSSKSITDSSKSATDSSKSVTDSNKSATYSNKSATYSSNSITDSNKSATDSSKSTTDSSKSVTDSNKSATDSNKSATDSSNSITDSNKSATDSSKSITYSSKSVTDSSKSVTDSRKSVTDSREMVTSCSEKPRNLDIHVPALNLDSLNAADATPDSGYSCSDAETPVSDKIIPHESQLHQCHSTPVMSGNTEEQSKSKGMNNVCQGEAEGETDLSSTNQTQNAENRTQNGENITQNRENMNQFGENRTQNGANRSEIGHESSGASNRNMNNCNAQQVSVDDHQRGAGNSVRQSGGTVVTQGASDTPVSSQRGEERSLVSLFVGAVFSFWIRPEFAYSS